MCNTCFSCEADYKRCQNKHRAERIFNAPQILNETDQQHEPVTIKLEATAHLEIKTEIEIQDTEVYEEKVPIYLIPMVHQTMQKLKPEEQCQEIQLFKQEYDVESTPNEQHQLFGLINVKQEDLLQTEIKTENNIQDSKVHEQKLSLSLIAITSQIAPNDPSTIERRFRCDRCNFKAKSKNNLRQHIISCHLKPASYDCLHYEFTTSCRATMARHLCPNLSKTNGALRPNIEVSSKLHVCDQCKHTFQASKLLYFHKRYIHTGVVKCKICFCQCGNKAALQKHMVKHPDTTELKCDECAKLFKHLTYLRQHK